MSSGHYNVGLQSDKTCRYNPYADCQNAHEQEVPFQTSKVQPWSIPLFLFYDLLHNRQSLSRTPYVQTSSIDAQDVNSETFGEIAPRLEYQYHPSYSIPTTNHHCQLHWHREASSLVLVLYNDSLLHDCV